MIRILDKHVADKIAAGEVIDRPVSIIKELIENSIDANADNITIEIKNGGKSYIRVTDNGCGIPADEAETAFKRHATSKISDVEDLNAINTLGFRGEALASICAVARVELITKTRETKLGKRIMIEGSNIIENSAIGCPDGTTITVRDLFYNVPARNKFLASDSSETRRIIDMVSRIALSYCNIKFNLINGNNNVFSTRGNGNILNNIISIFGSETAKDLIPVENKSNGFLLKGFVSSPGVSAPSRTKQIFCVNGRVVSSNVLEKALDEAYKEKLFHGRFPIAFLFLSMPADKLDVNVHPNKKEIRFDDQYEVADFVVHSIKKSLNTKEAIPQIRQSSAKATDHEVQYSFNDTVTSDSSEVDIKRLLTSIRVEEKIDNEIAETHNDIQERLLPSDPVKKPFEFDTLKPITALFNTYILATDEDSFYLIDQHAAHERIFYEHLLEQYNNSDKTRQTLLIPLSLNVSAQICATEEIWFDQVTAMGYDIEFFGNNTYLVREIPAFMTLDEAESFLSDMFKELEDKPDLTNKKILEKIIIKSCKSAVKGGDALNDEEINALLKDLKICINPFSCPHGRPTFIRMTKYEIEKMFKRV